MGSSLIDHNPLLKQPILQVLTLVEQNPGALRTEIEDKADPLFEGFTSFTQTPTTVVDVLLRNEALKERIFVDGEIYKGSLQDIQLDADIAEDAAVEQYISLSETGAEILDEYAGDKKLHQLFAEKPEYVEVFMKALEVCNSEEGSALPTLESELNVLPQLAADQHGVQQIYPQYFIDSLETAGAITWQGSWHTTEAGRAVMQ